MGRGKKKIDTELGTFFPGWFGPDLEHLENLRQWYLLQVGELSGEKPKPDVLQSIREYFVNISRPKNFNPYDEESILITEEKEFEEICNSMEDNGVTGVKEATVFEFYSKVQYLERKAKKMKDHVTGQ